MKRSILLLAIIALASCQKVTFTDLQEYNTGALIWNWKLVSLTIEQDHKTFYAKDYPDLQDDGIRFLADRTGTRYQGTKLFPFAPQVKELNFQWGIQPDQTGIFYVKAAGSPDTAPKNDILISVSADHRTLTMSVTGDRSFVKYVYEQKPD